MQSSLFILNETTGNYRVPKVVSAKDILEMASFIAMQSFQPGKSLCAASNVKCYLQQWLGHNPNEVFAVIFLDNKHRVIKAEALFFGTIDAASVHPRVVVQKALEHNAAALIFSHNHPSGITEPSMADKRITETLKQALALIDIRVLDHVIVSPDPEASLSFAERGLI